MRPSLVDDRSTVARGLLAELEREGVEGVNTADWIVLVMVLASLLATDRFGVMRSESMSGKADDGDDDDDNDADDNNDDDGRVTSLTGF